MTHLDLRRIVPEPPDGLLDWSALHQRIGRRRTVRRLTAGLGTVAVVTGAVIAGVSVSRGPTTAPIPGIVSRHDGRILVAEPTSGSTIDYPESALYALSPHGGSVIQITHQPSDVNITNVAASPDGRQIAYAEETYGNKGHGRYVNAEYLHVADADGADDRTIYRCPSASCGQPDWSPDSERLLFSSDQILEPDGSIAPLCAGGCAGQSFYDASWSPDGQQLAFGDSVRVPLKGGVTAVSAIGVIDSDGSHLRQLTNLHCTDQNRTECTEDTNPVWSPDGSAIAFTRGTAALLPEGDIGGLSPGPSMIETIRPDGTGLRQLVACHGGCQVGAMTWSPTGERLEYVSGTFLRDQTFTLHVIDAVTGRRTAELLSFIGSGVEPYVVWAPSGTALAIGKQSDDPDLDSSGVYVSRVTSGSLGPPRELTTHGHAPVAWLRAASGGPPS